jgi:anti-anti-sigma factor
MIRLKCFSCGLAVAYRGSEGDVCPRCLWREQQVVKLIAVSDQPSPVLHCSMGRLSIEEKASEGRHTIALSGELDVASAEILAEALAEACAAGARELVLDLGGIEFMDSTGLNAILRGQKLCEEHGCRWSLTPARQPVKRVLEVAGVLNRLSLHKTR